MQAHTTEQWVRPMPAHLLTPAASEPLRTTVTRTGLIALALGTTATLVSTGVPSTPDEGYAWMLRVISVLWFSFCGHWVELFYLRWMLPQLVNEGPFIRVGARLVVWYLGGAALWPCSVTCHMLLWSGAYPDTRQIAEAAYWGALGFIAVQLAAHSILYSIGWPSMWRARRGRLG